MSETRWYATVLVVSVLAIMLAGCGDPCPQTLKKGDIVHHKVTPTKYVILDVAERTNFEGLCAVGARSEKGFYERLSPDEVVKDEGSN